MSLCHLFFSPNLLMSSSKKNPQRIPQSIPIKYLVVGTISALGIMVSYRHYASQAFNIAFNVVSMSKKFFRSLYSNFVKVNAVVKECMDAVPPSEVIHIGFQCNLCHNTIIDSRYQCLNCVDYNLCSKCEPKSRDMHHPLHIFAKIKIPLPKGLGFPTIPQVYPGDVSTPFECPIDLLLTLMSESDILDLYEQFNTLRIGTTIPLSVFEKALGPLNRGSKQVSRILFNFFRRRHTQEEIDFQSFVKGIAILSRGELYEKMYYLKSFNADLDMYTTPEEVRDMIVSELSYSESNTVSEFRSQFAYNSIGEWNERTTDTVSFAFRGLISIFNEVIAERRYNEMGLKKAMNILNMIDPPMFNRIEKLYHKKIQKRVVNEIHKKVVEVATSGEDRKLSFVEFLLLLNTNHQMISWLNLGYTVF